MKTSGYFQSLTFGRLTFPQVLEKAAFFIQKDPSREYRLIIGSDSQINRGEADFVTALVVHRVGEGGIYFWERQTAKKVFSLRERIYTEAALSLILAEKLLKEIRLSFKRYALEIHVDIGKSGETRQMISEVVAMVRSNGFECKTKPEAYGASKVADRHA